MIRSFFFMLKSTYIYIYLHLFTLNSWKFRFKTRPWAQLKPRDRWCRTARERQIFLVDVRGKSTFQVFCDWFPTQKKKNGETVKNNMIETWERSMDKKQQLRLILGKRMFVAGIVGFVWSNLLRKMSRTSCFSRRYPRSLTKDTM